LGYSKVTKNCVKDKKRTGALKKGGTGQQANVQSAFGVCGELKAWEREKFWGMQELSN